MYVGRFAEVRRLEGAKLPHSRAPLQALVMECGAGEESGNETRAGGESGNEARAREEPRNETRAWGEFGNEA